jgi:hypothetical protein
MHALMMISMVNFNLAATPMLSALLYPQPLLISSMSKNVIASTAENHRFRITSLSLKYRVAISKSNFMCIITSRPDR